MSTTRISDSDLASVALYDKVNQMVDELENDIENKDSLPEQDGKTGKALFTNGTNAYWGDVSGVTIRDWSV